MPVWEEASDEETVSTPQQRDDSDWEKTNSEEKERFSLLLSLPCTKRRRRKQYINEQLGGESINAQFGGESVFCRQLILNKLSIFRINFHISITLSFFSTTFQSWRSSEISLWKSVFEAETHSRRRPTGSRVENQTDNAHKVEYRVSPSVRSFTLGA